MNGFRKHRAEHEHARARRFRPALRTATEAMEWYPGYRDRFRTDWIRAHGQPAEARRRPPFWARGDDGIDAWVTDTPEWDRDWFKAHDMLLPRFGDSTHTYWRDYGGGLRGLSYPSVGDERLKQ